MCLNPTFSGIWSATIMKTKFKLILNAVLILLFLEYGLRQDTKVYVHSQLKFVLILLFLEYGLRQSFNFSTMKNSRVLILLFLEYGLRPGQKKTVSSLKTCLNPTFSGIWSATLFES